MSHPSNQNGGDQRGSEHIEEDHQGKEASHAMIEKISDGLKATGQEESRSAQGCKEILGYSTH